MVGWLVGWLAPATTWAQAVLAWPSFDGMSDKKEQRVTFGANDADVAELDKVLARWVDAPGFLVYGTAPGQDKLSDEAIEVLISRARFLGEIERLTPNLAIREAAALAAFRKLAATKERQRK